MAGCLQPSLALRGQTSDQIRPPYLRQCGPAALPQMVYVCKTLAQLSLKHDTACLENSSASSPTRHERQRRPRKVLCKAISPSSEGRLNYPAGVDLMTGETREQSQGVGSVSAEVFGGNGAETLAGDLKVDDAEADASKESPLTAWSLLKDTISILYKSFWPLICIFALTDASMFMLHRVSHRITNQGAMSILGIDAAQIGHLWYLSNNPAVANFETGYQYLTGVFFLTVFPLNVLLRSFAATVTVLYSWKNAGEPNECPDLQPSFIPPVRSMYKNISCIWPKMRSSLMRVWMVDLLVAVRVLPLQFASLLIITLPLTLPRLLALQLANPASVVEELEGDEAIARSNELTKLSGVKKALLWPYVGLIVALRLVSMARTPALSALPSRWIRDVPEIPFLVYCVFIFMSVVLSRLQDVLPLAVFMKAHKRDGELKNKSFKAA